ncbi:sensor histidine kinase [Acinetobacter bereziniae]|uniref:sensor histidine kinase n=1 Tax=Acinetobacter bereziniae TaxID=106648 RepID=UPI001902450D|nr:sensor histidine kinase [Acinetobacter bereziniae]MBJ9947805.1 sensor histidine kinase [Acinetobacter bereziniae]
MKTNINDQIKTIKFTIESRILKELGERLVNDSSIALTELIKNSYDADASFCNVTITDDQIIIHDNGHGMSFEEFANKWMKIATANKLNESLSRIYGRKVTGSKGIGRFAVRFLGKYLTLETISENKDGQHIKLTATFDWDMLDEHDDLTTLEVPYNTQNTREPCGTRLIINSLRNEAHLTDEQVKKVKTNVIQNTSPIFAIINDIKNNLDNIDIPQYKIIAEKIINGESKSNRIIDPGFDIYFNRNDLNDEPENLATQILNNYVINAKLFIKDSKLKIILDHNISDTPPIKPFEINDFKNNIGTAIYADIRFFPKRAGVFNNKGVNGTVAWQWIKHNQGVKVYDHGFSITPYGHDDDDWLYLDRDSARSRRDWSTDLMNYYFPMNPEDAGSTKRNPMLALPNNHQLIGAVFIDSDPSKEEDTLLPSMDRQGYVNNESFKQLKNVIRFIVELIAYHDKRINLHKEDQRRKERYGSRIDELDAVINEIRSSPTLIAEDKERIIEYYTRAKDDFEELENYDKEARESLEIMSLLGVVAGFMTHEYEAALHNLQVASAKIKALADKDPSLKESAIQIDKSISNFNGYIEYTRLFIENLHQAVIKPYYSLDILEMVTDNFDNFRKERNIKLIFEIDEDLQAPLIPAAMYQGLVLNLFTNAMKALINEKHNNKRIVIQAWNEPKKHIIQVLDNGPGIPAGVRNRIWDPLYTTTSKDTNSLGSGMGLGLALVKRVVESQKGKISLLDKAPADFNTCFRIELPLGGKI